MHRPDRPAPKPAGCRWLGLARGFLGVFVLYLGPPLALVLLFLAAKLADPTRPLVAAGILIVAWVFVWWRAPEGDDDEGGPWEGRA